MNDTVWTRRCLRIIIIVAILARFAAAFYLGDRVEALPAIHDQLSYDALARAILAGKGYSFDQDWYPFTPAGTPTAHWSFLYPLYLAVVYAVFGYHPLIARLIQAVIGGVFFCWLAYRIGRRLFGPNVGLVSAGVMAIYAYFVYYAAALMTETLHIVAVLWALDLAMAISEPANRRISESTNQQSRKRGWKWSERWLLLGLALAIAALLRQVILAFVPILFAWLWWALRRNTQYPLPDTPHATRNPVLSKIEGTHHVSRPTPYVLRFTFYASRLLCSLLGLTVMIAPWTVRNYLVYHRILLLNSNAGYAFYTANHPHHGANYDWQYLPHVPDQFRVLNEAELNDALLAEGLRWVIEDPGRILRLSLSRVDDYFRFLPWSESGLISNLARTLSFGLFLPFMAYGLILSLRRWRTCLLLYLFMISYSLIHILSWPGPRYRLPVDAVLIVFAGLGLVNLAGPLFKVITWLRQRAIPQD